MLKFLTHKLRTHSLNEPPKAEERDSGTESDDESDRLGEDCTDVIMKWHDVTDIVSMETSPAAPGAGCSCEEPRRPEPDPLYDHHSSEEELEVINQSACPGEGRRRGASSPPPAAPEKRKWLSRAPDDDEEDAKEVETPVRFRTSPPREALKPRRAGAACACAPPSPRRRRAQPSAPPRRHRPALDFDKMQQLRVGGLRSWRGGVGGASAGELSVFCW